METLRRCAANLGLHLSEQQVEAFRTYYHELAAANRRLNLTAVDDYEGVQRRHFLESLALGAALDRHGIRRWGTPIRALDVGAGAGFPGVPLRIVDPSVRLTLVESAGKKAAFLSQLITRLGLEHVAVVTGRAEDLGHAPEHRAAYDLVLARAVAAMPVLLELTLPFLREGGVLAAPKGSRGAEETAAAAHALAELGGEVLAVEPLQVPESEAPLTLVVVRKVRPAPERYPRRPGVPGKRPL